LVEKGIIEDLREYIQLVIMCEGCREAALERWYPEEVSA